MSNNLFENSDAVPGNDNLAPECGSHLLKFENLMTLSSGFAWQTFVSKAQRLGLTLTCVKSVSAADKIFIDVDVLSPSKVRVIRFQYRLDHDGRELAKWGTAPEINEELWNLEILQSALAFQLILPLFRVFPGDTYFGSLEFVSVLKFVFEEYEFIQKIDLPSGGRFVRSTTSKSEKLPKCSTAAIDIAFDEDRQTTHIPLTDEGYEEANNRLGIKKFDFNTPVMSFRFDGQSSQFTVTRGWGYKPPEPKGPSKLCKGFSHGCLVRLALTETSLFIWARGSVVETNINPEFSMQKLISDLALFSHYGTLEYIEFANESDHRIKHRSLRVKITNLGTDILEMFQEYDIERKELWASDEKQASEG